MNINYYVLKKKIIIFYLKNVKKGNFIELFICLEYVFY